MNEVFQYKFYKRKNFNNFIIWFYFFIVFSNNSYENIVRKELGAALFLGILAIIPLGLIAIGIINNKRRLIEPGLIIDEQEIKMKLGVTLKYKIIKIKDTTSILVVDCDNIVNIYKGKKVIPISLYEYEKEEVQTMKEVFKKLGVEITNRRFQ